MKLKLMRYLSNQPFPKTLDITYFNNYEFTKSVLPTEELTKQQASAHKKDLEKRKQIKDQKRKQSV